MLCWCASLLYLPVFVSGTTTQSNNIEVDGKKISRAIFNLILTPIALITIVSGTLVFITMKTTDLWLILKLTLVAGLVICHVFNGWLVIKMDTLSARMLNFFCLFSNIVAITLIIAIIWIVLAKPAIENLI